jgi:hypothetical protein
MARLAKEGGMSIKVGEKVRDTVTKEEGVVVAVSDNTSNCVVVRFGSSFEYVIERDKREPIAPESPIRGHRRF